MEYWLFGWLSHDLTMKFPILGALVQNMSWPLQILYYKREMLLQAESRTISQSMYASYIFLGILSAFTVISKTIGLTSLPPTIYVICANTEIVHEAILTKVILGRNITTLQFVSVVLVILGLIISVYKPIGNNRDITNYQLVVGVTFSLCSRLSSAINVILAEK